MAQARAYDFVEDLDPTRFGVDAHDRQWTAHRHGRIAGEMDEAARRCGHGAARCFQAQDELVSGIGRLFDDGGLFDKDRASMRFCCLRLTHIPCLKRRVASVTASSTAMRTATPLETCRRMTDCGPSATAESISTPRFIGPGCMTMASGLARRSRSGVSPNWRK